MVVGLGLEVTTVVEQEDKMASVGSVREPRWMLGEQEVGREMEGCWRSERERRGRVTKPDSRPAKHTQVSIHEVQTEVFCQGGLAYLLTHLCDCTLQRNNSTFLMSVKYT